MDSAILGFLLLLLVLFVLYWLIRSAVHHGIIDAQDEQARRAERAELDRVRREKPPRYVENDPDV